MPTDSFDTLHTGPLNFVQDRACTIYGPCTAKEKKRRENLTKNPFGRRAQQTNRARVDNVNREGCLHVDPRQIKTDHITCPHLQTCVTSCCRRFTRGQKNTEIAGKKEESGRNTSVRRAVLTHTHTFMGTVLKEALLSQDVCIDGCIWVFDRFVSLFKRLLEGAGALCNGWQPFRSKPQARWLRCVVSLPGWYSSENKLVAF